jgi:hypothetical protein
MHKKGFHLVLSKVDICLLFGARAGNSSKGGFYKMIMIVAEWFDGERRRSRCGDIILRVVVVILINLFLFLYMLSRL